MGGKVIYFAAPFSRRHELRKLIPGVESLGYTVNSRWLNYHDNGSGEHVLTGDETPQEAAYKRSQWAQVDYDDVCAADILIAFTEPNDSTLVNGKRGGRHVELGMALALKKRVIVVGYRENVFCWHKWVEFYESWSHASFELAKG